jgi:alanine racemase
MALEIDSGMNRFGFKKLDESILISPYITTIYTHLFNECIENYDYIDYVYNLGVKYNKKVHIGGSIAYNYTSLPIRIGYLIYDGVDSFYGNVVYVHKGYKGEKIGYEGSYILDSDLNIAIIDVGYSNGIRRDFSGEVFLKGKRTKVVGKVCMNHIYIACDFDVRIGDIVEFYGDNLKKEEFLCKNFMTNYESFLLIR